MAKPRPASDAGQQQAATGQCFFYEAQPKAAVIAYALGQSNSGLHDLRRNTDADKNHIARNGPECPANFLA